MGASGTYMFLELCPNTIWGIYGAPQILYPECILASFFRLAVPSCLESIFSALTRKFTVK